MSIDCPTRTEVVAAQNRFFVTTGACIAALFLLHWFPKMQAAAAVRLFCTITYFAAVLLLLYQFMTPLKTYLKLLFAWRYETAPDAMQRHWKSLWFSLHQLIVVPCYLLSAFIASVALITLGEWFPDLRFFAPLTSLVWWCSLIGFLLFPISGGFLFNEVIQKYRHLSLESQSLREFRPRAFGELQTEEADDKPQSFKALKHGRFEAAGFDWKFEDFVQNCVVFGQIGSGKTSCVLNSILEGLFTAGAGNDLQPSGLILDPKGVMLADIRNLCLRYGRANDLLIIDPDDPASTRWNPFDCPDDEYELAARFAAVCKSLGEKSSESFWLTKATEFMQHALRVIRATNDPGTPPSFEQINEMVTSFTAIEERLLQLSPEDHSVDKSLKYFAREWATMAPETRSGVQGHLTGMLFPFLNAPFDVHFGSKSTISTADMIDSGKIVYLRMPTAGRERMARIIGIFLKLEYYRQVLLRPDKKRPSFFFCDEFQRFFTGGTRDDPEPEKSDADTFRLSRQSYHANVVATQNIGAFGESEIAGAFLGNCLTSVFLRNPDEKTNEFASKLFGEEIMNMGGAQPGLGGGGGMLRGIGGQTPAGGDQRQRRCPADRFRELAICSREQEVPHTESIVFLGARSERPIPIRTLKWKRHPLSLS